MTVTTSDRSVAYTGNGATVAFPYSFKIYRPEHVKIRLLEIATGVVETLSDSQYQITGVGYTSTGGVVTYPLVGAPLASTHNIIIEREVPYKQEQAISNQAGYRPETVERSLDLNVMMAQQLAGTLIDKVVRVPDYEASVEILPPVAQRKGKFLFFDASTGQPRVADGTSTVAIPPGGVTGDQLAPGAAEENLGYHPADGLGDMMTYGAVDDGVTNCAPALVAAKAAVGAGGTVRFRKVTTGRYYFGAGGADLSGIVIDADDGVVIAGFINLAYDINLVRPGLRIDYDADIKFTYIVGEKPGAQVKPKISHLPDSVDCRRFIVGSSMWFPEKLLAWGADDWLTDATAVASDANAGWTDLTNDSYLRAHFVSAWGEKGFRELTFSWDYVLSSNAGIGIVVKCSQGWISITCLGDESTMLINRKAYGVAWTPANQTILPQWYGRNYHQSWLPRTSVWSVRPLGPYDFVLALNGVIIAQFNTNDLGWIMEQGPVSYGNQAGPMTITAARATIEESERCSLGRRLGILATGDSRGDNVSDVSSPSRYPVSFFDYVCSYLDGSNGCRVTHAVNLSVAGATFEQQAITLATFLATPAADNITDAVIALGTNDIQGNTNYVSVFNTLGSMIDSLKARGIRVTVSIPDEFYPQVLAAAFTGAANQGQGTTTYQIGAPIRTVLRQQIAQKTVPGYEVGLVDGTRAIGLELADWLGTGYWTRPRLSDNIHGDSDLYPRELGFAIAREMFRLIAPQARNDLVGLPLPPSAMGAGFVMPTQLYIQYDRGRAALIGIVEKTAGSWTGASVFTVPRCFRGAEESRHPIEDFSGVWATGVLKGGGASWGVVQSFITTTQLTVFFKMDWLVGR